MSPHAVLDFRPANYFDAPDPVAALTGQIKGELRRFLVARALLEPDRASFDEWEERGLTGNSITEDELTDLARCGHWYRGWPDTNAGSRPSHCHQRTRPDVDRGIGALYKLCILRWSVSRAVAGVVARRRQGIP